MIRVDRGEEPDELPRERSTQLACAKIYGRPEAPNDFTGYGEEYVRNALLESQRFRCAYCELPIDQSGFPIEHFRPKVCADDVNWSVVGAPPKDEEFFAWFDRCFVDAREPSSRWVRGKDRYWWLAWSWENLFYACSACNSRAHKGNKFPLKPGSVNLSEMEVPPGSEIALLLDPSIFDPLDHIRFAPDREDNWGPIPRTDEGRWTIAILGLNKRPGLRDRWKHCARQIRDDPDFKFARDAISAGFLAQVVTRAAHRSLSGRRALSSPASPSPFSSA
jgi:5-methylcytosine-specific restriction endonuclease McrA